MFFSRAPLASMVFQWFCRHGTIDKPDHLTIRTGTIMYLTIDFNGFWNFVNKSQCYLKNIMQHNIHEFNPRQNASSQQSKEHKWFQFKKSCWRSLEFCQNCNIHEEGTNLNCCVFSGYGCGELQFAHFWGSSHPVHGKSRWAVRQNFSSPFFGTFSVQIFLFIDPWVSDTSLTFLP